MYGTPSSVAAISSKGIIRLPGAVPRAPARAPRGNASSRPGLRRRDTPSTRPRARRRPAGQRDTGSPALASPAPCVRPTNLLPARTPESLGDLRLGPVPTRFVIDVPCCLRRPVRLVHPPVRVVVRVQVALAVPETRRAAIVAVT